MTNTETVGTERLEPCPFCGGSAQLEGNGRHWFVQCIDHDECGAHGYMALDDGYAVESWNRRASRTQEPAEWQEDALRPVTMQEVRLSAGEGKLSAQSVLAGVNGELARRRGNIFRAASITPPAPERSKEDVPDRGKCAIAVQRWTILTGGDGFSGYYYAEGPGDLRIRTNDRALLDRILSALEPASLHEREDDGSDAAAIEIADAVIAWMVKYDLLDADLEYRDDDIIAVLDDLAPETAPLPVTIDDTSISARFNRLYGICRRILWADASTPAIGSEQTKAALADLAEFLFADGIDAALSKPGEQG